MGRKERQTIWMRKILNFKLHDFIKLKESQQELDIETTTELKPCPFCGGRARVIETTEPSNLGGSAVECTVCHACSPVHFDRKENLYSAWNDRVSE